MFAEIPYDIYHYDCALCNKEVKTEIIKTCIICNRKICDTCFKEGFCMDHYNLLTSEGKLKLNEVVEEVKKKKKKLNKHKFLGGAIIFAPFILAPAILYFLFSPNIFGPYYDSFFLFLFFIFVLCPGLPLLYEVLDSKVDGKKQKLMNGLKEDKLFLFDRYTKEIETQVPRIEKKCENCGRILKKDSEYCDKCGSKI